MLTDEIKLIFGYSYLYSRGEQIPEIGISIKLYHYIGVPTINVILYLDIYKQLLKSDCMFMLEIPLAFYHSIVIYSQIKIYSSANPCLLK